ncbi:MliC family protein [Synechococcus sp. 1G10]|uniref:MliC family protein n=1 Tax=Synechococcus sp. 1G10 TaxID=2025605 RepID=UPI000B99090B|nr:MliC family protein [Synechococcus sp. 1G10]
MTASHTFASSVGPLLFSFAVLTVPAMAVPPPVESFDGVTIRCTPGASATTVLICRDAALRRFDDEVRRLFTLVRTDPSLPSSTRASLLSEQRLWVEQRQACWQSAKPPTWDADLRRCVLESTLVRLHLLRQISASARREDPASISQGPIPVACPEIRDVLRVTLVNGQPEFAVVESNGRLVLLTRTPSASGVRYVSSTTSSNPSNDAAAPSALLWIKGEQVQIEWPTLGLSAANCRFQPVTGPHP